MLQPCAARQRISDRPVPTPRADFIEDTAALVGTRGGSGIPVQVDHTSERQVAALFQRIDRESGRLDLVVSNVWQWGPHADYDVPTWQQPVERWDAMFGVGVRSQFLTARAALPLMLRTASGLIVSTQERPGDSARFGQNMIVDTAAVATKRLVEYLGHELSGTGVGALLVYLGWVRTVNRGMGFEPEAAGMSTTEFTFRTQSPYFVGRAIASLANDERVLSRSGQTIYAGDVALEYGFTDIDGRVPAYDGGELIETLPSRGRTGRAATARTHSTG